MRLGAQPYVPNELEAHVSGDGAGDEQDEGVAASAVAELGGSARAGARTLRRSGAAPCALDDEADGDRGPVLAEGTNEAVFDDDVQESEEKLGIGGASALARRPAVRYAALDGDSAKPDVSGHSLPAEYDGGEERPPSKGLDDESDGGHDAVPIDRKLHRCCFSGGAEAGVGRRDAGRRRVGARRYQRQPACELRRGG
ncbi:unnamed protein product [Prorocentrum cordatum]|uniref:Uncharacterized protein n=1 Tax=Prorocentrum cordatum TaxID=2364126 RepID=A0ABN9YCS2_9DINO|nr:unnamed protein product [Polarella glacialis]